MPYQSTKITALNLKVFVGQVQFHLQIVADRVIALSVLNRSSRRSWITLCCHGSTSYIQYKCSVQAIINMLFRVNISPEFIWIQVLLQSVGFHFFLTSPAISFISCQAARREKMRSRRLFSAQSLWKCAIGNFSVWLLPNGICFLCSCTKPLKRDHVF